MEFTGTQVMLIILRYNILAINQLSQSIDLSYVGEHVINVIGVRWIIRTVPVLRCRTVTGEDVLLQFTLIINTIKPNDLLNEPSVNQKFFFVLENSKAQLTCCRNLCSFSCDLGLMETSYNGINRLVKNSLKLFSIFFER